MTSSWYYGPFEIDFNEEGAVIRLNSSYCNNSELLEGADIERPLDMLAATSLKNEIESWIKEQTSVRY